MSPTLLAGRINGATSNMAQLSEFGLQVSVGFLVNWERVLENDESS